MRVTNAPASRERRRRRLELAKGFYGARSKLFRTATEAVDRAMRLSTEHRKLKKRLARWGDLTEAPGGMAPLSAEDAANLQGIRNLLVMQGIPDEDDIWLFAGRR